VEEEVILTSIDGKKKKVNRKVLPLRQENRRVSQSKSRRMKSRISRRQKVKSKKEKQQQERSDCSSD
jgi:hypothetical protein